jgi:hypothetical protein
MEKERLLESMPTLKVDSLVLVRSQSLVQRVEEVDTFDKAADSLANYLFAKLRSFLPEEEALVYRDKLLNQGCFDSEGLVKKQKPFKDDTFEGVRVLPQDHFDVKEIYWRRPARFCHVGADESPVLISEAFGLDSARTNSVAQGHLDDCFFLSALSLVAGRYDLLKRLFVPTKLPPELGLYCFQFYKDGLWQKVVVDDQIPCKKSGEPIFARSTRESEFWVPLVEKAYAKLHGAYTKLHGGESLTQALVDLTGGVPVKFLLCEHEADMLSGKLFETLLRHSRKPVCMFMHVFMLQDSWGRPLDGVRRGAGRQTSKDCRSPRLRNGSRVWHLRP